MNKSKTIMKFLFLLFCLFMFMSQPSYSEQYIVRQSKDLTILYDPALSAVSNRVAQIFPEVKSQLEAVIGWNMPSNPSVMLIKDASQFQRMAESPLTVAFAYPQENMVVIDCSRVNIHPLSLDSILTHELCHLLLHYHIPQRILPRWFDEGVCQWVSGGIVDIMMQQKRSILNRAALRDAFIPLHSLHMRFPRDEKALILAYEQSKSIVDYIIIRFGKEGLLAILDRMKTGDRIDTAIYSALSISLDDLEYEWHHSLRINLTWFTYFSYHLYDILFALLALITVVGFIRIIQKKRTYTDTDG